MVSSALVCAIADPCGGTLARIPVPLGDTLRPGSQALGSNRGTSVAGSNRMLLPPLLSQAAEVETEPRQAWVSLLRRDSQT
jgi:hypothetical protein